MTATPGIRLVSGPLVKARRHDLGLTVHALASNAGIAPAALKALEQGASQNNYTVAALHRLSQALATPVAKLIEAPPPPETGDTINTSDVADVGSDLLDTRSWTSVDGIANRFGWTPERARLGLDRLDEYLAPIGASLEWRADAQVRLRHIEQPAEHLLSEGQAEIDFGGISHTEARLLHRLTRYVTAPRKGTTHKRLLNAGLVTVVDGDKISLSRAACRALMIAPPNIYEPDPDQLAIDNSAATGASLRAAAEANHRNLTDGDYAKWRNKQPEPGQHPDLRARYGMPIPRRIWDGLCEAAGVTPGGRGNRTKTVDAATAADALHRAAAEVGTPLRYAAYAAWAADNNAPTIGMLRPIWGNWSDCLKAVGLAKPKQPPKPAPSTANATKNKGTK